MKNIYFFTTIIVICISCKKEKIPPSAQFEVVSNVSGKVTLQTDKALVPLSNYHFHWDFGDGIMIDNQLDTISHLFATKGDATITLKVFDDKTGLNSTSSQHVSVAPLWVLESNTTLTANYPGVYIPFIGSVFLAFGASPLDIFFYEYTTDVWMLDFVSKTWIRKGEAPFYANGIKGFSIGDKIYMGFGSIGTTVYNMNNNPLNQFWAYTPATNTWAQKNPPPSANGFIALECFNLGDFGYTLLGSDTSSTTQLWRYTATNDTWDQVENPIGIGSGVTYWPVAGCADKAYLFTTDCNEKGTLMMYQPNIGWSKQNELAINHLTNSTGVCVGNKIWFGGGIDCTLFTDNLLIHDYSLFTNAWEPNIKFEPGGAFHNNSSVHFLFEEGDYLHVISSIGKTFSVWRYDP